MSRDENSIFYVGSPISFGEALRAFNQDVFDNKLYGMPHKGTASYNAVQKIRAGKKPPTFKTVNDLIKTENSIVVKKGAEPKPKAAKAKAAKPQPMPKPQPKPKPKAKAAKPESTEEQIRAEIESIENDRASFFNEPKPVETRILEETQSIQDTVASGNKPSYKKYKSLNTELVKKEEEEVSFRVEEKNSFSSMNDPEFWKGSKSKERKDYLANIWGMSEKQANYLIKKMNPHLKKAYDDFVSTVLIHDGHKLQQPQHGNGAGNDEKGSSHPALFCKRLGEGRQ